MILRERGKYYGEKIKSTVMLRASFTQHLGNRAQPWLFAARFWSVPVQLQITESQSQNHRMVGVGRDLCGSSSPTPLPKQGHLQYHRITESQNHTQMSSPDRGYGNWRRSDPKSKTPRLCCWKYLLFWWYGNTKCHQSTYFPLSGGILPCCEVNGSNIYIGDVQSE